MLGFYRSGSTMSSPGSALFENYPELSQLPYVFTSVFTVEVLIVCRRDDLQDLLHDQQYFQAIFHSLEHVKAIYRAQDEIVMANEAIASEHP
jgi:hypothetical protein